LDQARARTAKRRIELHRDDPFPFAKGAAEGGLALLLAECDDELALVEMERCPRLPFLLDSRADRRDLGRGCAAAAADDACAKVPRVRGELGEVLRCRMRIDDAPAGKR